MTEQDDITDMKKCRTGRRWMIGLLLGLGMILAGCGSRRSTADDTVTSEEIQMDRIVVGFSQLGAESDWRSANTESMKSTFTKEAGYDLIFEDGQQKQANQIRAIRTFIQQEVDYIVLAPVTETGWDTVLREAKDAGIPVIIVDRKVDVEDDRMVSHTMATYCKYFLSCVFEAVTMALAIVVCNAFINAGLPAFTGSYL
jgi:ABC-type sugar transport system substrate-binding protein